MIYAYLRWFRLLSMRIYGGSASLAPKNACIFGYVFPLGCVFPGLQPPGGLILCVFSWLWPPGGQNPCVFAWVQPACGRNLCVFSGILPSRGSRGRGSGRDPKNPIFEACSKPSHFLHRFSIRFAILGSGGCRGSFGTPRGTSLVVPGEHDLCVFT